MQSDHGTILVVDDSELNRDLLTRRLERHGYIVISAVDGAQALELIQVGRFDIVLLDVMMPGMDGYEVLKRLKANPTLRHIPVIMISAVEDLDSVVKCIELGAEDYLTKPFNPVLLRARISACLEKKWLRDQEQAYLHVVKQEMELGRRIQADFFPAMLPQPPGWEIAAAFQPAREVAGDFYDAFELPNNKLGLLIADVCDKGVGAALYMTLVRSLMRAFADQSPTGIDNPLYAIELTNSYIARHHYRSRPRMFATLFFGVVDITSGIMTYVNSGHLPPVLLGPAGIKTMLDPTGPAIGLIDGSPFSIAQTQIEPGDTLIAYTDGITEARNTCRDLFGEDRLLAILQQPAPAIIPLMERIKGDVYAHVGHTALADDITMLAIRRI
ncbi:MAG: SpoIIE family protein phosphatase [Chloroflexales bacterium]|nr:SpoIIE family protein phosphatase [Chloroflexales bacterium]